MGQDGIRMASCGRLAIGLHDQRIQTMPIANLPQIYNLPQKMVAGYFEPWDVEDLVAAWEASERRVERQAA